MPPKKLASDSARIPCAEASQSRREHTAGTLGFFDIGMFIDGVAPFPRLTLAPLSPALYEFNVETWRRFQTTDEGLHPRILPIRRDRAARAAAGDESLAVFFSLPVPNAPPLQLRHQVASYDALFDFDLVAMQIEGHFVARLPCFRLPQLRAQERLGAVEEDLLGKVYAAKKKAAVSTATAIDAAIAPLRAGGGVRGQQPDLRGRMPKRGPAASAGCAGGDLDSYIVSATPFEYLLLSSLRPPPSTSPPARRSQPSRCTTGFKPIAVSFPGRGLNGTFCAIANEQTAKPAPTRNTAVRESSQMYPRSAGITTAAMWLMVKETPAVEAMSAGSAIFWKYVLMAMASAKNMWSSM